MCEFSCYRYDTKQCLICVFAVKYKRLVTSYIGGDLIIMTKDCRRECSLTAWKRYKAVSQNVKCLSLFSKCSLINLFSEAICYSLFIRRIMDI